MRFSIFGTDQLQVSQELDHQLHLSLTCLRTENSIDKIRRQVVQSKRAKRIVAASTIGITYFHLLPQGTQMRNIAISLSSTNDQLTEPCSLKHIYVHPTNNQIGLVPT